MSSVLDPTEKEYERSARSRADLVLVQAALAGRASAYEQLVAKYRKSLYHVIRKMVRHADDADDLTQEVFAKAFRALARYRSEYAFSTWLFRIATNHCIDFLRRQQVPTRSLQAEVPQTDGDGVPWEVPDPAPDPQEQFIRQQRHDLVQRAVARLPPKYRQLVRWRYFEEWSYEEIAVEQQLPLGTVKAQLFRSRQLLLELIQKEQPRL